MSLLQHGAAIPSGASTYDIDNSIQVNSVTVSDPPRFNRTNSSAGNRKTFTVSFWHKRGVSAHGNGVGYRVLNSIRNESGKYPGLFVFDYRGDVNSTQFLSAFADEDPDNVAEAWFKSDMSFRDESAWYHIVIAYDTTQGTASNRRAMYVNGVEQTYSQSGDIPQHHQSSWNDDTLHCIGAYEYNLSDATVGGYLAEVHNIDGLKLDASYFGEFDTSGIWKAKEYDGNYGTNGFRLQFKETGTGQNASGLGADTSGNNHHFATVGHTAASQATDTPTNNFCTMNGLKGITYYTVNGPGTLNPHPIQTNGGTVIGNNSNNYVITDATMAMTSGKWYWEMKPTVDANTNVSLAGIATNHDLGFYNNDGVGNFFYHFSGSRYVNGGATGYGTAWATNDIIGFAYDADNWNLTCYLNNTSQGNLLASQADLSAKAAIFKLVTYGTHTYQMNFGGYHANSLSSAASDANGYGSFEYAPPSGYYALCTKNLAKYGG